MLIVPCDNVSITIYLELYTQLSTYRNILVAGINNRCCEAYFIACIDSFLIKSNLCYNEVIASRDRSIVFVVIIFSYIKLFLTAVIVSC